MSLQSRAKRRLATELRRLARRLSRWADATDQPAAPPRPPEAPGGDGPPEHWLALVREKAPQLLEGKGQGYKLDPGPRTWRPAPRPADAPPSAPASRRPGPTPAAIPTGAATPTPTPAPTGAPTPMPIPTVTTAPDPTAAPPPGSHPAPTAIPTVTAAPNPPAAPPPAAIPSVTAAPASAWRRPDASGPPTARGPEPAGLTYAADAAGVADPPGERQVPEAVRHPVADPDVQVRRLSVREREILDVGVATRASRPSFEWPRPTPPAHHRRTWPRLHERPAPSAAPPLPVYDLAEAPPDDVRPVAPESDPRWPALPDDREQDAWAPGLDRLDPDRARRLDREQRGL
jgi:hypothetical protein